MSVVDDFLVLLPAEETALRDVRVAPFWTVEWTLSPAFKSSIRLQS